MKYLTCQVNTFIRWACCLYTGDKQHTSVELQFIKFANISNELWASFFVFFLVTFSALVCPTSLFNQLQPFKWTSSNPFDERERKRRFQLWWVLTSETSNRVPWTITFSFILLVICVQVNDDDVWNDDLSCRHSKPNTVYRKSSSKVLHTIIVQSFLSVWAF